MGRPETHLAEEDVYVSKGVNHFTEIGTCSKPVWDHMEEFEIRIRFAPLPSFYGGIMDTKTIE